ncbi:MAG: butyrate kinase [Clostridioides sp.]|jgi:butyrate kinase|nr:butyrate kinase [Clostridioides sp.]
MSYKILAINPGSTSTKIAVYDDEKQLFTHTIDYPASKIAKYDKVMDQLDFRKESILEVLKEKEIDLRDMNAIVGRGGALPPVHSGAYEVNDLMVDVFQNRPTLEHASNLGGVIAKSLADMVGIKSYIYDPVTVNELSDVAKITGIPSIEKPCNGHALNTRAMALKYVKETGKDYNSLNIIVAHVGGGSSVYLHNQGVMSDYSTDDDGPMSPQRSGRIPGAKLVELCFSGEHTKKEVLAMIRGKGGLVAHLGTADVREVESMINDGDEHAKLIYDAMLYQTAKSIGELATVVDGDVDVIIITGGIAYSKMFTSALMKKVEFISEVVLMPGENELEALAFGILRVLRGEEKASIFKEDEELSNSYSFA